MGVWLKLLRFSLLFVRRVAFIAELQSEHLLRSPALVIAMNLLLASELLNENAAAGWLAYVAESCMRGSCRELTSSLYQVLVLLRPEAIGGSRIRAHFTARIIRCLCTWQIALHHTNSGQLVLRDAKAICHTFIILILHFTRLLILAIEKWPRLTFLRLSPYRLGIWLAQAGWVHGFVDQHLLQLTSFLSHFTPEILLLILDHFYEKAKLN